MIVVDTNIIAYLLIQADHTAACRKVLLKDPEWCSPFLWRSELRNVLTIHIRHAGMTLAGAIARMEKAEELLKDREYSVSSTVVLEIAQELGISAYDAEFMCLAEKLDCLFVTTDKKLLRESSARTLSPESFAP